MHQVVYTSTHDTDTLAGALPATSRRGRSSSWRSRPAAALAMVPVQDVLELGSEARMNRPGELGGNWCWRLEPGQLEPELAARLRAAAEASDRA